MRYLQRYRIQNDQDLLGRVAVCVMRHAAVIRAANPNATDAQKALGTSSTLTSTIKVPVGGVLTPPVGGEPIAYTDDQFAWAEAATTSPADKACRMIHEIALLGDDDLMPLLQDTDDADAALQAFVDGVCEGY